MEIYLSDIVRPKYFKNEYYIVIDLFSLEDGDKCYEIMKIYPFESHAPVMTMLESELDLIAKEGSVQFNSLHKYISNQLESANKSRKTPIKNVSLKTKTTNNDIIQYDEIDSVDECLDALNDLKQLYELFGDEAYLQLYELVLERVRKIA